MIEQKKQSSFRSLFLVLIGVGIGISLYRFNIVTHRQLNAEGSTEDFSLFWKASELLNAYHVNKDTITSEDKLYGAIHGLVWSYNDPYTEFFPPKEDKAFDENIKGEFEGLGMEVMSLNGVLTIISPLKSSPAELAGILPEDIILSIDGFTTANVPIDESVDRMRGPKGTLVQLSIYRPGTGETLSIDVIRDTIKIPTLEGKLINDEVYYINVFNFSENAANLFAEEMIRFDQTTAKHLVIDLRNNPGGFLEAAVDISSWFVEKGEPIVIEAPTQGEETVYRSKGYKHHKLDSIYVLVNRGSASASEIVAGALQDYGVATIVGETTYGKGSVQELFELTADTSIKITVAKWLTPHRNSIDQVGITPDVEVLTEESVKSTDDLILEKVLNLVQDE